MCGDARLTSCALLVCAYCVCRFSSNRWWYYSAWFVDRYYGVSLQCCVHTNYSAAVMTTCRTISSSSCCQRKLPLEIKAFLRLCIRSARQLRLRTVRWNVAASSTAVAGSGFVLQQPWLFSTHRTKLPHQLCRWWRTLEAKRKGLPGMQTSSMQTTTAQGLSLTCGSHHRNVATWRLKQLDCEPILPF